jgi:hypothetical protein
VICREHRAPGFLNNRLEAVKHDSSEACELEEKTRTEASKAKFWHFLRESVEVRQNEDREGAGKLGRGT